MDSASVNFKGIKFLVDNIFFYPLTPPYIYFCSVLNLAFYIAKKIAFNSKKTFSSFIVKLSVAATAISVAAMIITLAFLNGFQETVSKQVFSFWGHSRVQHYQLSKSTIAEEDPILPNDTVFNTIKSNGLVKKVQPFATKAAVIQYKKAIEGVLLKGITANYDSNALKPYLKQGKWLPFVDSGYSKQVVLSVAIAKLLQVTIGDTVKLNFIDANNGNTYRKLQVCGIYKTGIEENDKLFVLADLKLIQRINNWENNEIGGYEIFLNDYTQMDSLCSQIKLPIIWQCKTVKEVYPAIFNWLNVLNTNRNIVFIVMSIVAIINLITGLIVLVLERYKMIGVLKALGSTNQTIQQIFLLQANYIALKGIFLGIVLGVGICLLQQYTGFITLDETNYYVATAPVSLVYWHVAAISIGTFIICVVALVIPSFIITKISPIKAIRFQ